MMINQRFFLNDDGLIIDKLNTANNLKVSWYEELGYEKHETCFREMLLWRRLGELLPKLLVQGCLTARSDRPACKETLSLWPALHRAIKASHLNSLDVSISLQHKFEGDLKREKKGMQAITSLSLFVDDIERRGVHRRRKWRWCRRAIAERIGDRFPPGRTKHPSLWARPVLDRLGLWWPALHGAKAPVCS